MSITYTVESFITNRLELEPFVIPHWEELGLDHQDVPVNLDWDRYAELERAGGLHHVAVRDNGAIIGYTTAVISPMFHYATTLHAIYDLYYLLPQYRKSKIGVSMFLFAERCFRDLGVKKVMTGTKLHLNHEKLFLSLGMKPIEVIYTKIL